MSIHWYIGAWQLTLVGNNSNKRQLFKWCVNNSRITSVRRPDIDPTSNPTNLRSVDLSIFHLYMKDDRYRYKFGLYISGLYKNAVVYMPEPSVAVT